MSGGPIGSREGTCPYCGTAGSLAVYVDRRDDRDPSDWGLELECPLCTSSWPVNPAITYDAHEAPGDGIRS